uniref:VPS9 domain-containing protein n=1 Tax=Amazona collaria TaxID=241587 RepID=A0A8B9IUY9_9PSIT
MLKLAEQCLERVKSIAAALGKAQAKPAAQERGAAPAALPRHRRVLSDEGGKLSPFLPPEIFQKLQITEAQSTRKELTPLEEASLQNQKLKAAYEARVARLNPSQALQKTSLTLSLQRQMMENLVIAKAREETLQRKMEERRLRLQEAANRRFSSSVALTPEEQEQRALYAAILEYEQDHDWPRQWKAKLKRSPADLSVVSGLFSCLLSFPEHPIAQLLRQLQCAVYARLYPAVSRDAADSATGPPAGLCSLPLDAGGSLPTEPGGRRLRASRSLHCMFSVPEHGAAALRHSISSTPLAAAGPPKAEGGWAAPAAAPQTPRESSFEDLERFLASPEGWAPAEPLDGPGTEATLPEQLKGIVRDIHNAIDRLLSLTLLAFEGLNTAAGKDQCLACLEEAFFPPLWAPLLALYRSVHQPHEAALARSMERHRHAGPTDMGLASRLLPPAPGCPAYGSAIEDLRLIPLETCPRRKLECIVRALRGICECAEEYCGAGDRRTPTTAAIGADDLLPILSYVVLQTGLPQLLSECAALEEFIHEGMCAGSALRQQYGQQYRHCLEREFRRGRAVPCSDPSFVERLRWRLRREPSVLRALQEDAPELLARGLRGWPDPGRALPGLARAFRLLELAAVNLYLFPWRKEFGTVQTFSGAYVHSLRSALPEDDLERSFARLGYERQDQHRLTVARLPPEPELLAAACGFLACRLECEILVEVMLRLRPHQPSAQDLLRARWLAGDMEACVEMLQQMGIQPEVAVGCSDNVDLYQPVPSSPEDMEGEDMLSPAPQSDPGSPLDALDLPMRSWDCCGDLKVGQELVLSVCNPDLDTSSSHLFRQQDLSGASSLFPTRAVGSRTPPVLGEPQDSPCPSAPEEAPELPCYQLHTCLRQGALPSYCCTTCQQLHTGACAAGLACRSHHRGQELRSERQQRLWLQRSEVDMLLSESCGPQS